MSVVSGYSMHLYCDGIDEGEHPRHWEDEWKMELVGETYGECAKDARSIGWYISRDRMKAYCPKCAKKKGKQRR